MRIDLNTSCDCEVCGCVPRGSWFREWMQCWPTSEPPHSYILLAVMGLLGGVLGRKVYMMYDSFRPTYSMLNILLIGPSGIGKSTSVSMAKELLPYIPQEKRPQFISGSSTKEKLHADLVLNSHAIVFASELAALFSKEQYKEGLIPYVTQLLDYEPRVETRTKKDDVSYVENPEVTFIGASTREWITNMLPDTAATGGFLPRFLPVLEDRRGQRIANPRRLLSVAQNAELEERRERVKNAFTRIGISEGPVDYEDDEAASRFTFWYNQHFAPTGSLAPFYARAGEMILRMSILFAVSCNRMELTEEDIDGAVALYMYLCKRFSDITVATTPAGKLLQAVREAITYEGTNTLELFRDLSSLAIVPELQKQINSLVSSGQARVEENTIYRIK